MISRSFLCYAKLVQLHTRNLPYLTSIIRHQNYRRCLSNSSSVCGQERKLTLSYDHCVSDVPLIEKTLPQLLDDITEKYPDKEAIVCTSDDRRVTFAEFVYQADQVATSLLALGLVKGDRVGVWGQNHVEWLVAFYGVVRAGLIAVNVNPAYRSFELEYALNKVQIKALFMMPTFKTSDYYAILHEIVPEMDYCSPGMLNAEKVPHLKHVILTEGTGKPGTFSFTEFLTLGGVAEQHQLSDVKKSIQFDDVVNIQFTSGTTGNPKGAALTHHNLVNNGYFCNILMGFDASSKICIPPPLYHCFGLVVGQIAGLYSGATQVFPARGFEPEAALKAIHQERCTSVYGTPAMFIAMLNCPSFSQYDFKCLQSGIMGGSPCPTEIMNQIIQKMHCPEMLVAYGLTETSPATTFARRHAPVEKRVSTVGQLFPHVEGKVIDQKGNIVPVNTPGEVCFRGHNVFQGYWDDEIKTRESIDANRWFHSGDLAEMTEDGYVKIVGRIKDIVIRGGENIYPTEIENFLYKHPKVQDIQVFGVPDSLMGEEVVAWIRLRVGESCTVEEIKEFCKGKISHYKIPRYIEFVEEFPMTVTGKMKKVEMRKQMMARLGL